MNFTSLLVANRSEIAIRIIRAAADLGFARWGSIRKMIPLLYTPGWLVKLAR